MDGQRKSVSSKAGKKGGKSPKVRSAQEEAKRREVLKETLREKLELERKALLVVERLLDDRVAEEFLIDCARLITPANYIDTVEERSIAKMCGYPVCPNKLTNVPTQQYKISTKTNKVYDITERKCFCSNFCFKASKFFEVQISKTPLWLRKEERPPDVKLMEKDAGGISGLEVKLVDRPVSKTDIENPNSEPADLQEDLSDVEQDFVSSVVTKEKPKARVHWGKLPKRHEESEEEQLHEEQSDAKNEHLPHLNQHGGKTTDTSPKLKDPPVEETFDASLKTTDIHSKDALDDKTNDASLKSIKIHNEGAPVKETNDTSLRPIDVHNEDALVEETNDASQKAINVHNKDAPVEKTSDTSLKPIKVHNKDAPVIETNDTSQKSIDVHNEDAPVDKTTDTSPKLKDGPMEETIDTSQKSIDVHNKDAPMEETSDTSQKPIKVNNNNHNQDAPVEETTTLLNQITLTDSCPSTVTPHDASVDTNANISHVGMSKKSAAGLKSLLQNHHKTKTEAPAVKLSLLESLRVTLLDWRTEDTMRFLYGPDYNSQNEPTDPGEEEEELDEDDLEDVEDVEKKKHQSRPSAAAPDYKSLKKETELLELRVREFYKGVCVLPEETDITNRTQVGDTDPPLPPVDSQAQRLIQKRIAVEKLSRSLRDIVGPLRLSMSEIINDINNLVRTFRLTNVNIIHKPPEWTLIAVVLLSVLTEISPLLRKSMASPTSVEYISSLMKELRLNDQDLQSLVLIFKPGGQKFSQTCT